MTASEFRNELKHLSGGYLFCGEEDYLMRHYLAAARDSVVTKDDVFNRIIITSDNYSPDVLMSALESLPVMSDRKFIEISGLPLGDMKEQDTDDLCDILSRLPEYEYNILIIYADADNFDPGTAKTPSKLFKKLPPAVKPVMFPRETPARLASWTAKHFAAGLIVAPPDAVNRLISRCGCDMSVLASEIDKLTYYLKSVGREKLTEADVDLVSSESREIAAFDFANAILDGNAGRALSILSELRLRKEKPEIILSGITRVICDLCAVKALLESGASSQTVAQRLKMHSYKAGLYIKSASRTDSAKLRRLASICYDADIRIKTTPLDSYGVLDRLTVEASMRG